MEQAKARQINSAAIPMLRCPYCMRHYPRLILLKSNGGIDIQIRCLCTINDKVLSIHSFLNLLRREQIVGIYKCSRCSKTTNWFCIECLVDLCRECSRPNCAVKNNLHECSHRLRKQNWKLIRWCSPEVQIDQTIMNVFNDIISRNKRLIVKFMDKIDSLKEKNEEYSRLKSDIQSSCDKNEKINEDLIILYFGLLKTEKIKNSLNSKRWVRKLSIDIDTKEYNEKGTTIEEEYWRLKAHLQSNYVLKQNQKRVRSKEYISTLEGHSHYVSCLIQLKNGQLASGSCDNTIKLRNITTVEWELTLTGHTGYISSLIQLLDGLLASGSSDGTVKLWNSTTNQCLATLNHKNPLRTLVQLDDGNLAVGSSNSIKIWNLTTNECITSINLSDSRNFIQLNDGRLLSTCYKNATLWDKTTFLISGSIKMKDSETSIQLSDRRLAFCCFETIKICCIGINGIAITRLEGHTDDIYCLIQLIDGRLASGSLDNSIKLWSTTTNQCVATYRGYYDEVLSLVQLQDGRLAFGSTNELIRLLKP